MDSGQGKANLLTGRWQIPVALAAAVMASVALYRLRPPPVAPEFDALLADIPLLAQAGRYTDAADAAMNLLEMEPPLPDEQRAQLHVFLAQLVFDRERQRQAPNADNVELMLTHNDRAVELGVAPDTAMQLRTALGRQWRGDDDAALYHYRTLLQAEPDAAARRMALRNLVELLDGRPAEERERRQYLYALLAEESVDVGTQSWALRQALADALEQGDTGLARELSERCGGGLQTSDLRGYYEFLNAWVLGAEGRGDEATPLIYWVEDWLHDYPQSSAELTTYGNLPAQNRWLLGRLHLVEERPQDALTACEEALALQPDEELWTTVMADRGRALALLGRHATALRSLGEAVDELVQRGTVQRRSGQQLQEYLRELYAERQARGELHEAIGSLELATRLIPESQPAARLDGDELLGRTCAAAADAEAPGRPVGEFRRAGGAAFERAAALAHDDGERYRALVWAAAEQFDRGGWTRDARRMLLKFIEMAGDDPRLAQALLSVGQGYEREGHLAEALEWYRRLVATLPALEEAARARLYMVDCLVAAGPEQFAAAEEVLNELLAGEFASPDAAVFRDALLRQCRLLFMQGRYGEAIGRLESFRALYPNDPAHTAVGFVLAEVYRRSALALREGVATAEAPEPQLEEAARRLRTAADLYDRVLAELGDAPAERAAEYARLALFNRGDCLLALNTPESLREALETYQQAAVRYDHAPAALIAQVQIANIHLRQGRLREAAQAVERARWLLRTIPQQAFAASGDGMDHAAWDGYLTAVASSHLLRDALTAQP